MKVIRSPKEMTREINSLSRKGRTIGFVPTMGCLHEGHLSLIRRAVKENDITVVSIFVNPAQFGPKEDFKRYPRNFKRDKDRAGQTGADIIFYPSIKSIYPRGYSTYVNIANLSDSLCGNSRPGHFQGVVTIVTKLFNIVKPDKAYFGQKDAQQAIIIKQLVEDLNLDLKLIICPIVRDKSGLALSSRNRYLGPQERSDAKVLNISLQKAGKMIKSHIINPTLIKTAIRREIKKVKSTRIDYIEIVGLHNLKPVKKIKGRVLIALAIKIGKVRLIDNLICSVK